MTSLKAIWLAAAGICVGVSGAWTAPVPPATVIPSNGPSAGGNAILVTNMHFVAMRAGARKASAGFIANVLVDTNPAVIQGQGLNWVQVVAPPHAAGTVSIKVQFESTPDPIAVGEYAYNPSGRIGDLIPGPYVWTNLGSGMSDDSAIVLTVASGTNGELYAGGTFTVAGGVPATNVAKWDGFAWTNIGTGIDDMVRALAVGKNGELYAGGWFNSAGGAQISHIAKWNGEVWTNLGAGVDDMVYSLAVATNGELYAGGVFTNAGGLEVNNIAKWDGAAWTNLGVGMECGEVQALAIGPDGELYAGGAFTVAGGLAGNNVAKWDGFAWTNLGDGITCGEVQALAVGPSGELYAGGEFSTAGDVAANNIARWDGAAWTNLGEGVDCMVCSLAVDSNGELYAGGEFSTAGEVAATNIAKWNGTTWTNLGLGIDNTGYSLSLRPNGDLYVGGCFDIADGRPAHHTAKYWPRPVIGPGGVSPSSGFYMGGYMVIIRGENLCNGTDVTNVTICGVNAANIESLCATQVVVVAGVGRPGLGDVRVYSASYGETVKSNGFFYTGGTETNLPAPVGVSATYGTYTNMVRVTWSGVAGATFYQIMRNTTNNANGASVLAYVTAEDVRALRRSPAATAFYTDDYRVSARISYYYWVRALNVSGVSPLSEAGMGYAELASGRTVGRADLTVSDMVFLPVNLTNGSPAGTVSYRLLNAGPDALAAAPVRFDFYMIQGNQEAWLAYADATVTLAAGAERLFILDAQARRGLRARGDLTGQQRVQARARHLGLAGDEHAGSNMTTAPGTVLVRAAGVNSPGRSGNDYDGDGKADGCLYQGALGRWHAELSGMRYEGCVSIGDIGLGWTPVPGDYDGDGITDLAAYDGLSGQWIIRPSSSAQVLACQFGGPDFVATQCDFDGDSKTDPVVYRAADGCWAGAASSRGYAACNTLLGGAGYQPVAADYDGDGLADPAVYNWESGLWGIGFSSAGYQLVTGTFGGRGYLPAAADYDGDGLADPAIYAPGTAYWQVLKSGTLATVGYYTWWGGASGNAGGIPVPADYDGDGKADLAGYHRDNGIWEVSLSANGYRLTWAGFGGPEYQPAVSDP